MTTLTYGYTGMLGEIADLLISVEADHHDAGWDNSPATMYRVSRGTDGPFRLDPVRLGMQDIQPRIELRALADAVTEHPQGAATMESLFESTPVAHLLIMEMWMHSFADTEERDAEKRLIADIPGSVETRNGFAIVGKRMIVLNRTRGQEPHLIDPDVRLDLDPIGMVASLRDIHYSAARHWRSAAG